MLEIVVNGITVVIAIIEILILLLWSKLLLINEENIIISIIRSKLNRKIIGILEKINFLVFLLFSDINLERAIGIPRAERLIRRLKVGKISIYKLIPLIPIILVVIIFISIPKALVMNPPNIRIVTDFINEFFMINFMKKLKKIYHSF